MADLATYGGYGARPYNPFLGGTFRGYAQRARHHLARAAGATHGFITHEGLGTLSLGGIVSRAAGAAGAGLAYGALDRTAVGSWFLEKTGGWLKSSTALALIGAIARGLRLDTRYAPRLLQRANTAILTAKFIEKSIEVGSNTVDYVAEKVPLLDVFRGTPEAPRVMASVSGVGPTQEPIPGEATIA